MNGITIQVIVFSLFVFVGTSCGVKETSHNLNAETNFSSKSDQQQTQALYESEVNNTFDSNNNSCSDFFNQNDVHLRDFQHACRNHSRNAEHECRARGSSWDTCWQVALDAYNYCNSFIDQCMGEEAQAEVNDDFDVADPFQLDWPQE